jgi:hypothetical protein
VADGLITCLPPVTVGLEGDYRFAPSVISLTHILCFSPPSMHSLLQWKKRWRHRHQRPNQILLHNVWLRSPCPRREGCRAVIRARQETYSNGEMNQATSGSVSSMGIEEQENRKKKNKIGYRNRKKKTNKIGNKTRRKTRFEDKNLMILTMVNQSKGKKVLWCPCWG